MLHIASNDLKWFLLYVHVTFLTPTDFDFESYHVANRVFKKVFGVFCDDVIR